MKLRSLLKVAIMMMVIPGLLLSADTNQEKHKVGVSVGIVPVYATDSGGYPVNNLKPHELKLKINGKEVPFQFINYGINLFSKKRVKKEKAPGTISKKIHVVIIDTLFNTRNGIIKSKEMIKKFIKDDAGKHRFLLLRMSLLRNLENLTEITNNPNTLIEAIDKVDAKPSVLDSVKFSNRLLSRTAEEPLWDARDTGAPFKEERDLDRAFYKTATYQYEAMFDKLKYLLTMIKAPKICFLFSEGISRGALMTSSPGIHAGLSANSVLDYTFTETANTSGTYSSRHLRLLKGIASQINSAGSIMFGINPLGNIIPDPMDSGQASLSSIAGMSGGKYFEGSDPSVVFKTIKHTTSAYYELAYSSDKHKHKLNSVEVVCTRAGITLNTIKSTRGIVTYSGLDDMEKKLFVLDMLKGSQTTNMKIIGKQIETDRKSFKLEVPSELTGKNVDIFRVSFNKEGNKINITTEQKKLGKTIRVKADPRDAESYLVMVQPEDNISSITKIVF